MAYFREKWNGVERRALAIEDREQMSFLWRAVFFLLNQIRRKY